MSSGSAVTTSPPPEGMQTATTWASTMCSVPLRVCSRIAPTWRAKWKSVSTKRRAGRSPRERSCRDTAASNARVRRRPRATSAHTRVGAITSRRRRWASASKARNMSGGRLAARASRPAASSTKGGSITQHPDDLGPSAPEQAARRSRPRRRRRQRPQRQLRREPLRTWCPNLSACAQARRLGHVDRARSQALRSPPRTASRRQGSGPPPPGPRRPSP